MSQVSWTSLATQAPLLFGPRSFGHSLKMDGPVNQVVGLEIGRHKNPHLSLPTATSYWENRADFGPSLCLLLVFRCLGVFLRLIVDMAGSEEGSTPTEKPATVSVVSIVGLVILS